MEKKELKKFVMVKFVTSGTNDVVPKSWLTENNTRCCWPGKDFNGDMTTIIKNQYNPLPTWKQWKCSVLCHSG